MTRLVWSRWPWPHLAEIEQERLVGVDRRKGGEVGALPDGLGGTSVDRGDLLERGSAAAALRAPRHAGDLVPDAEPGFLDQPRRNVQVAVGGQVALAAPPQKGGAAFGNVENAEGGCGHLLTREIAVSHRTAVRATSVPVSLVGSRGA